MIKGRTSACLAADNRLAAEDHSRIQRIRRNLSNESRETNKNEYAENTPKFKIIQKS